jgi:hypothetical protein
MNSTYNQQFRIPSGLEAANCAQTALLKKKPEEHERKRAF